MEKNTSSTSKYITTLSKSSPKTLIHQKKYWLFASDLVKKFFYFNKLLKPHSSDSALCMVTQSLGKCHHIERNKKFVSMADRMQAIEVFKAHFIQLAKYQLDRLLIKHVKSFGIYQQKFLLFNIYNIDVSLLLGKKLSSFYNNFLKYYS